MRSCFWHKSTHSPWAPCCLRKPCVPSLTMPSASPPSGLGTRCRESRCTTTSTWRSTAPKGTRWWRKASDLRVDWRDWPGIVLPVRSGYSLKTLRNPPHSHVAHDAFYPFFPIGGQYYSVCFIGGSIIVSTERVAHSVWSYRNKSRPCLYIQRLDFTITMKIIVLLIPSLPMLGKKNYIRFSFIVAYSSCLIKTFPVTIWTADRARVIRDRPYFLYSGHYRPNKVLHVVIQMKEGL